MAAVAFPRRRRISRKLFDETEINNNPPPPPPPPQDPFQLPPLPPLPPVEVNFPAIPPPPDQDSQSSVVLAVTFLVIGAVITLSCCLRAGGELSRRRRAAAQPQQPPPQEGGGGESGEVYSGLMVDHPIWYIRTVGLQSHVINAITVCKYKEVEGVVGRRAECAVCLNGFQQDDTLRMLPKCNHAFHVSCIDTWLKSHTNCPVCRAIIELVDVEFPGGTGNRPGTRTGTPVDNRRGQRPDTNGDYEQANPIDIPNLELSNNVDKNENEGE